MILNALNNQFVIYFPRNFFYPEVEERWNPIVRRLKLPYETLEDFINATIQKVSLPGINLSNPTQQQRQFAIQYRTGKELEAAFEKTLNVTFKLSEGFISYWIMFEQLELFLKYQDTQPFWPPMYISFLGHHGFELVAFEFQYIVPQSMSQFDISYATTAAEFNTFNVELRFNRFNISRRIGELNKLVPSSTEYINKDQTYETS